MKSNELARKGMLAMCLLFLFFSSSCRNKLEEYYQEPDWLKGSAYEILQERGNYSIFLKAIDLSDFKPMVNGKNILTVMAPNDSAFLRYLKEVYHTQDVSELTKTDLNKLVGFHLLYYSFGRDQLINFRPAEGDAATKEDKNKNAGLYYKFRTKSQDENTIEVDTSGVNVSVYHSERFLPIFSHRMFQTKQIDPTYNYEYFFPNTPWKGDAVVSSDGLPGFNVANAAVDEYAAISKNGYVYFIDRVLRPLETIYKELHDAGNYSDYLALYDQYGYYQLDPELTLEYGNGTDLYQHYHTSPMPNIASEWPVTDYKKIDQLAYTSYSVFAPNNEALSDFFEEYWKIGGYDSLQEVSHESIEYLLFNTVYSSSVVFPEEISRGQIENSYGTVIKFDVENDVRQEDRKICVNGVLYGCSNLTPPAMFGSVTGPAFQYKKFSNYLSMLKTSDIVMTLCSDATNYLVLYPSNEVMLESGISYSTVQNSLMRNEKRWSNSEQQSSVYAHIVSLDGITGGHQELPLSGNHVFRTLSPGSYVYWYIKDGQITNSIKFTELLNGVEEDSVFCDVIEEQLFRGESWSNGKCYAYSHSGKSFLLEGSMVNAINPKFIPMLINNRGNSSTLYHGFAQLLDLAELIDVGTQSINMVIENCLMFVPTTDVVKRAVLDQKVPGVALHDALLPVDTAQMMADPMFFSKCVVNDEALLQDYLRQYFIPMSSAVISNYPYVGWQENVEEGLPTLQSYDVDLGEGKIASETTHLHISDAHNKLTITVIDRKGNRTDSQAEVIDRFHYFPFVYDDGCVHFINKML